MMHCRRNVLAGTVLLILVLTALPVARAQPGETKIEPQLLDQLATEGAAGFMVRFVEQADLSPAPTMNWEERGEFVYNALKATAARTQAGVVAYLDAHGLYHETYVAGNELFVRDGTAAVASDLASRAEVASLRALRAYYIDPILALAGAPPDSPNALAWGLVDVHADDFWATFGVQGDGMVVANIDTGVQWDHPALDQAFKCGADPSDPACWADPSNICGGSACDNNGHGTHTMGTMVGDDDPGLTYQVGMAPNALWIACKGCESTSCSDTALNACADWLLAPGGNAANRPHVVNNSWGGGGGDNWYQAKVQAWRAAGIFPVFASGGDMGCGSMGSPGDYQESFATTGHNASRVHYYAQGPSAFGHEPYTKPNVTAPAVSICSTIPPNSWSCGYSGSTMASPHAAGAVALLWSCNPGLIGQVDLTFQTLQNNADPPDPPNPACGVPPDNEGTYEDGYGYLNVLQAGIAACANVDTGTLDGYVRDSGGDPVPSANVLATPGTAGIRIDAITDPDGHYSMTLVVGTYDVTASKSGYTPQTVTGVQIITNTITYQDFVLIFLGQWMPSTQPNCFDWTRLDAEYFPATGKAYVLGGRSGTNTIGDIYVFDPVADTCVDTGANMPTPIANYTVSLVNNGTADLLCTFGGRQADGTGTLNVQCYDPIANTASIVTTLPSAYSGYTPGAQVVVDNKVYVIGGLRTISTPYEIVRTDRFDPTTNTFTQVGNLSLGRGYIMAAAVDEAIYAFGGAVYDGTNLTAQKRTEKMADPGGAGTWDNAAVAEMPQEGAEGQAFGFGLESSYNLSHTVVLAAAYAQWPGESAEVVTYDLASNTYDDAFPNLNTARRNQAGVLVPLCSESPTDGRPAMWVIGGRSGSDSPPYAAPEYYPLICTNPGPPEAAFSSDSPVCLGEPMHLTDLSMAYPPITAWFWDFGDGVGTSTERTPVYTYAAAGDYVVTLGVTNTEGSDWVTGTVQVDPLPEATFVYTPTGGLLPLTVYFTATLGEATNPQWDFGDGETGSGLTVQHTYNLTGTFPVTLSADSLYDCGQAIASGSVDIRMAPEATFSADPPSSCGAPLAVQFTDLSQAYPPITTWAWDFGDGSTSTAPDPLHTYTQTGDFTVTLGVTNTEGSDWATGTVRVAPLPEATFVYTPIGGLLPLTVYFTNTSTAATNPTWAFGDGVTGTGDLITHAYNMSGTYTVTLRVDSAYGCGSAQAVGYVDVAPQPPCEEVEILEVTPGISGCVVDLGASLTGTLPFTYEWDFGSFGTFTTSTATVDFMASGTYSGLLQVWNCTAGYDMLALDVTVACESPPVRYTIYLPLADKY